MSKDISYLDVSDSKYLGKLITQDQREFLRAEKRMTEETGGKWSIDRQAQLIGDLRKGVLAFTSTRSNNAGNVKEKNNSDQLNRIKATNEMLQNRVSQLLRKQKQLRQEIQRNNNAPTLQNRRISEQLQKVRQQLKDSNRNLLLISNQNQKIKGEMYSLQEQMSQLQNRRIKLQNQQINYKKKQNTEAIIKDYKNKTDVQQIFNQLQKLGYDKKPDIQFQMKKKLRETYFSAKSIQQQCNNIAKKLFYYPSEKLATRIQRQMGQDVQSVIYKCAAFKHADLAMLSAKVKSTDGIKEQIQLIMKLIPWGTFFIDVKMLQQKATNIIGGYDDTTYNVTQYDLVFRISKLGITVKHNNKSILPNQMKNTLLKQMAIQSLQRKATKMYFQFLKMGGSIY